jgi:hypothetical protein
MAIHRKSSKSGPPKLADKQVTAPKTVAPVATAAASSYVGGTDWIVLSTTNAWDSSQRVTEFLEDLKTGKPIGKVSPLFLLMLQCLDTFH